MRYSTILTMAAIGTCMHGATATTVPAQSGAATSAYALPANDVTLPARYRPRDVRIVVSVDERRLWVIAAGDTVRSAQVSVAAGRTVTYAGRRWKFATPRGALRVLGKRTDPVWRPPEWHYAEVASRYGLKLKQMAPGRTKLRSGAVLTVRDSVVGLLKHGDTTFLDMPVSEHIVFDSTLYVPPVNTHNRQLQGELGRYALDLGNGYLLHGTFDQRSIGVDTTHGCIRLADDDLEWLYHNIPVGTTVFVR